MYKLCEMVGCTDPAVAEVNGIGVCAACKARLIPLGPDVVKSYEDDTLRKG